MKISIWVSITTLFFASLNAHSNNQLCSIFMQESICKYSGLEAKYNKTAILNKIEDTIEFRSNNSLEKIYNGYRSEVTVNYPYKIGDTVEYKFEIKMPSNFTAGKDKRKWIILAQWHDQPNKALGETWNKFPARSPPVSLQAREDNGKLLLFIDYPGNKSFFFSIPYDEWVSMSFLFNWSPANLGSLKFQTGNIGYIFDGKNMWNNYHHYLKFGIYRSPTVTHDLNLFFRKISINTLRHLHD